MTPLQNKIDFLALFSVSNANPNGDPLNGNYPRVEAIDGLGMMTPECIKRKIRNRLQEKGYSIFVQATDLCDDGCQSLSERASSNIPKGTCSDQYETLACQKWLDVRAFGQVFAFKGKESSSVSVGIRGPVSIHTAFTVAPVVVQTIQITKSVNGETSSKKSPDTMGSHHIVRHGLYVIKGAINAQLAEKTGFSTEDANAILESLRTLFLNDASAARPDGSMEVQKVYWWRHNCKNGQYSSAKVHRSIEILVKDGVTVPNDMNDYNIIIHDLPGLKPEILDGY